MEKQIEKQYGQYTGLKDKNGKEIYEGDIIKGTSDDYKKRGIIKFGEYKTITWENAFGTNSPNQYGWYVEYIDKTMVQLCIPNSIEVIGNIYDNPELLEVQDE